MRTTLNLDSLLLKELKKRSHEDNRTLTSLFEEAIRKYLAAFKPNKKSFKFKIPVAKGLPLPGVDFSDRDSLYSHMGEN